MATHKYRPGDYVVVHSPRYGLKPGVVESTTTKSGTPFYRVKIDGLGMADIIESRIQGTVFERNYMQPLSEKIDAEMKKLAAESDETTEGGKKEPGAEIVHEPNPEQEPTVPGGAPGPLSPSDIKKNPNDIINADVVKDMGAK